MRERLVVALELTLPDFFVAEVRLDAAAARLVVLLEAVLLEAVLLAAVRGLAAVLAAPRADDREAVDLVERPVDFVAPRAGEREVLAAVAFWLELREVDFAAVLRAVLLAAVLRALLVVPVLRAVLFTALLTALFADRVADFTALLAAVARPPALPAADFVERPALFVEPRADDLAAVRVVPLLAAVPRFAAVERDELPVDLAADLRAVVPVLLLVLLPVLLAADFLALVVEPLLRADVVFDAAAFPPVELRRAPLFLDRDVGRIASTAPVISWVSGFDLSSVGIAASFKGLRVQPSRLQGNVVIPRGFRLTESVESRTGTIPVDTFW
ncbi:hypothetical protein [Microvirga pudoricolor]|uniref:hypothetical protein n=1 Tax=Microvirga pudoricolor TaxID=2778729 RepID=UPI0019516E84|nr:hypothetical protein [Microvirga pudoricolor]MBM6593079.1 hypothetical protein [Microvirga pudoricolor]